MPTGVATIPRFDGTAGRVTARSRRPAFDAGVGLDDTFLRRDPATNEPMLMIPGLHPYQRIEAARKIMNNTTTVSNVFAVWVTVGYFEVTTPVGTAPEAEQWGKEYYFEVPGDMRQKMFAIVDRTQIGVRPELVSGVLASLK